MDRGSGKVAHDRRSWPFALRLIYAMIVAGGPAVANIYHNQPMLGLIAGDFRAADRAGAKP